MLTLALSVALAVASAVIGMRTYRQARDARRAQQRGDKIEKARLGRSTLLWWIGVTVGAVNLTLRASGRGSALRDQATVLVVTVIFAWYIKAVIDKS